jgi:hypothetical protein
MLLPPPENLLSPVPSLATDRFLQLRAATFGAKAGIQGAEATAVALDPRFRDGDDTLLIMLVSFRAGL